MSLLRELAQAGVLRTLDDALAQSLRRLDPDTPEEVLAAAALASLAVAHGDAGFDPARPRQLVDAALPWPAPQAWLALLSTSRWVATPDDADADAAAGAAPLVLEGGLLYLRRYREYERRLAGRLRQLAGQPMRVHDAVGAGAARAGDIEAIGIETSDTEAAALEATVVEAGILETSRIEAAGIAALAPLFAQLFPDAGADDRQARAAAVALRRALLLVTGGPGTGKTTTIARLLVLRIAAALQAGAKPPRIALAAPTGRAAERMAESLRRATAQMAASGVDPALLAALPTQAGTLHRLLGVIPDSPRFRHHADHPLPFDIVVVDEASMVDLPLMCKLAEAVAEGAQLVLLGDPDQLPSVEAGDVLAAILAAAGDGSTLDAADARALQPLLGGTVDVTAGAASDVAPHTGDLFAVAARQVFPATRIHLTRGYRQSDALQLAPLADAVRAGDARQALALLRGGQLGGIAFHEHLEDPLHVHGPALLGHWRALAQATNPAAALHQANRLRLLTALREGPQGARGLNARIEAQLSGRRHGSPPAWFPGRLLLVIENSYRQRLFNGDVGVCLAGDDGVPLAWFPGEGDGAVRAFHPAALPAHESAFAMTVHKAQGSEFDEVWLQLPRGDSRVLSRELLYTGLTRARSALHLAGSAAVIEAALGRHAGRVSGLAWRLATAAGPARPGR
jgi:exodeoxyribonuclease V alpha subunit